MDFGSIPLFGTMRAKLSYMSERQSVLARNIANADTPGYHARDVEAPDFKNMVQASSRKLPLAVTNSGHVGGSVSAMPLKAVKRKTTYEQNPVGNNVAVEEEMMRVAQNQAEYQQVINMYRKTVAMFKTALGSGQNS